MGHSLPRRPRAAVGLADDADSSVAIARMLGTTDDIGTSAAARVAVQRSLDQRWGAAASNIARNLKGIPATASNDVKAFWNADLIAAHQEFRAAGGGMNPFNFMGEVDAATGLHGVFKIDPAILRSPDVLPHVGRMGSHMGGALVSYGIGVDLLRRDSQDLYEQAVNSKVGAAQLLNLPGGPS